MKSQDYYLSNQIESIFDKENIVDKDIIVMLKVVYYSN